MADQNTHINYSLTDIERYLQGRMSAKEMHDMERAALQDPFLADAIEGYNEAPFQQSHKHLNEITALLQVEKKDAKIVAMPAKKFQWLRVAAMLVLVAGAGTISWYILSLNNNPANEKNIAQVATKQEEKTKSAVPPAVNDTTTSITLNYTPQKNIQKNKAENYKAKENTLVAPPATSDGLASAPIQDDADKDIAPVIAQNAEAAKQTASAPAPAEITLQKPLADSTINATARAKSLAYFNTNTVVNEFKGRVTDNNNQPVANAIVNAGDLRAVYTDASGYFTLKAPDSLLNVTISSVGFLQAQTELRSSYSNNIAVVPDNQSLSEIVVTGYATDKKALNKRAEADSLFPAGGWESFQDYVYKKLHKKLDSTNNGGTITGNVEVEFLVREDGTPYNFNVVKSLNQANDAQAIDIIKKGPRWIGSRKNKKAKVTIPF